MMTSVGSNSHPLVSALVTTFNHERFIVAALESLKRQTYRNIEIIVVDDGSSDRTVELVRGFTGENVRLLHTDRGGPSQAMNLAMSNAEGEIFLLQSGDDLSEPTRAERQTAILQCYDLTTCMPRLINDAGDDLPDDRFSVFFEVAPEISRENLFKSLFVNGNFLCASSVSMRRSVWETIGGFHCGLLQLQDYDYWLRVLAGGYSISIETERLISYRLHTDNLSDVRHDVRTQRELATLLRELAATIPDDLLVAAIYGGSFAERTWSSDERQLLQALFFLRHPAEPIRQIGIDRLIDLTNQPGYDNIRETFGIDRQCIFRALLHR